MSPENFMKIEGEHDDDAKKCTLDPNPSFRSVWHLASGNNKQTMIMIPAHK
jgi:hypothetical protein